MLIGIASDALITRRNVLEQVMRKGLLPTLSFGSETVSSEAMPLIMNLVGLEETLSILAKDQGTDARTGLAEKIVQTARQVALEKSGKNEKLGVAVIDEEGAQRLAALDAEKYGRSSLQPSPRQGYSLSPWLSPADVQLPEKLDYVRRLSENLNGGLSTVLDASGLDLRGIFNLISSAEPSIPFFRVHRAISFCRNCGSKLPPESGRCKKCKSTATAQYSTAD
jgi:anaerobic ribonucleoside-triphosphate reductase